MFCLGATKTCWNFIIKMLCTHVFYFGKLSDFLKYILHPNLFFAKKIEMSTKFAALVHVTTSKLAISN